MNILRFDSAAAWLAATADLFCQRLRQNPERRLCLAAGDTPLPLYAALVAAVRRQEVTFRQAEVFALDEYGGLSADDPGRCANVLRRHLVDDIDLPPERFHFLDTLQVDLDGVCADFDARIETGFDLTLLGIGQNGHLGLNEPGSAGDSLTRRTQLHEQSTQAARRYVHGSHLPTWGATIGMHRLRQSREVWLLARGPSKAAIVERLVHGREDDSVPASLLKKHPNFWLWVDAEAGARL